MKSPRGLYSDTTIMLALLFIVLSLFSLHAPLSARRNDLPLLSKPLKLAWSYNSADALNLSPVNYDDQLYVPLNGGKLAALQLSNGNLNWKTEVGGLISAAPDADENGVYVATEVLAEKRTGASQPKGLLRLLSRDNGVVIWVCETQTPLRGALSVLDGVLYAASGEGRLYAIEAATGAIKWSRQNGARLNAHSLVAGNLLFLSDEAGIFSAVKRESGETLWRYQTRGPLRTQPAIIGGTVFIGTYDQQVLALDAADGSLIWRAKTSGRVQGVSVGGGRLVAITLDNFVYGFSAESGKRLWKSRLAGRVTARPLLTADGVLLTPLTGDEAVILNPENGRKINSIEVGEDNNTSAEPAISGDMLLLSTRRGIFAYVNAQALNRNDQAQSPTGPMTLGP